MTSMWRVLHAGLFRGLERDRSDVAQATVWVCGNVPYRTNRKLSSCVLSLSGGDEPGETGP
jgi:hypothetical protein